jgi:glutamate dehydrogenase (NADP+)
MNKLKTVMKIKAERGGRVGRYIIASTTAKFLEPENIFSIPCDIIFACGGIELLQPRPLTSKQHSNTSAGINTISGPSAQLLADNGCTCVVEGCDMPSTPEAIATFKKRGMLFGPYKATMAGGAVCNGITLETKPLQPGEVRVFTRSHTVADSQSEFKYHSCA